MRSLALKAMIWTCGVPYNAQCGILLWHERFMWVVAHHSSQSYVSDQAPQLLLGHMISYQELPQVLPSWTAGQSYYICSQVVFGIPEFETFKFLSSSDSVWTCFKILYFIFLCNGTQHKIACFNVLYVLF